MDPAIFAAAHLGLPAGTVAVVDHDPRWSEIYEALATELQKALREFGCSIEHVGSTAVPQLVAKPILDVAVGFGAPIDRDRLAPALATVGFAFATDLGNRGGLLFTRRVDPNLTVANLHAVDIDGFQWRWYLKFRDILRADVELRTEYGLLKRTQAARYPEDRPGYADAKSSWILGIVTSGRGPTDGTGS